MKHIMRNSGDSELNHPKEKETRKKSVLQLKFLWYWVQESKQYQGMVQNIEH